MQGQTLKRLVSLGALCVWSLVLLGCGSLQTNTTPINDSISGVSNSIFDAELLPRIRQQASSVAGDLPTQLNFVKIAESHRTYAAIIDGGSEDRFVSARTAFQIQFQDSTIMVDTGMDEEVHRFYGFGRTEPYWPERNAEVQQALLAADKIVVTHEHGDHVAGVLRSDDRELLAKKTYFNAAQVNTLINKPQIFQIALTPERAASYQVLDFESTLAIAPGVVLIRSAGHTPGHQMVYVRLANEREFLLIGDIGWSLDNISQLTLRPANTMARIGEDGDALMQQMRWIKEQVDHEGVVAVPSHDDRLLEQLVAADLLQDRLKFEATD